MNHQMRANCAELICLDERKRDAITARRRSEIPHYSQYRGREPQARAVIAKSYFRRTGFRETLVWTVPFSSDWAHPRLEHDASL